MRGRAGVRVLDKICPTQKKSATAPTMAYGEQGLMGVRISLAPLPVGSPLVHKLGPSIKVLHVEKDSNALFNFDNPDGTSGTVLHYHVAQPWCVYQMDKMGFFEDMGLVDAVTPTLVRIAAHPKKGNVAAFEIIEALPAIPADTPVVQNGRCGTVLFDVDAGQHACVAALHPLRTASVSSLFDRMRRLFVKLNSAGDASTHSGSISKKCTFLADSATQLQIGGGGGQVLVTPRRMEVLRTIQGTAQANTNSLCFPPFLSPIVEVQLGEKPGHGLNAEKLGCIQRVQVLKDIEDLPPAPAEEGAQPPNTGGFHNGDVSDIEIVYPMKAGVGKLQWKEEAVNFVPQFTLADAKMVERYPTQESKHDYPHKYLLAKLKLFSGTLRNGELQRNVRRDAKELLSVINGEKIKNAADAAARTAAEQETRAMTCAIFNDKFDDKFRGYSPEYDALLTADHPAASHKKRKELEPALGYADSDGEMLNDKSRDFLMRYMLHDLALYLAENPMPHEKNVAFVERHAAMKLACKDNGEPLKIKAAVAGSEDRAAAAVKFLASQGSLKSPGVGIASETDIFEPLGQRLSDEVWQGMAARLSHATQNAGVVD